MSRVLCQAYRTSELSCGTGSSRPSHRGCLQFFLVLEHNVLADRDSSSSSGSSSRQLHAASAHSSSPPPPGGPDLPICRALSISSQSRRFDAMPVELAMLFRSTRKLSKTPCCSGSMGSPSVRSRPATWPSACSS